MARSVAPAGSLCLFEPAEAVCLWLGDDWHGHGFNLITPRFPRRVEIPHRNANKIETKRLSAHTIGLQHFFVSDRKRSWEFGEKF